MHSEFAALFAHARATGEAYALADWLQERGEQTASDIVAGQEQVGVWLQETDRYCDLVDNRLRVIARTLPAGYSVREPYWIDGRKSDSLGSIELALSLLLAVGGNRQPGLRRVMFVESLADRLDLAARLVAREPIPVPLKLPIARVEFNVDPRSSRLPVPGDLVRLVQSLGYAHLMLFDSLRAAVTDRDECADGLVIGVAGPTVVDVLRLHPRRARPRWRIEGSHRLKFASTRRVEGLGHGTPVRRVGDGIAVSKPGQECIGTAESVTTDDFLDGSPCVHTYTVSCPRFLPAD